jgi:hypothetical protein
MLADVAGNPAQEAAAIGPRGFDEQGNLRSLDVAANHQSGNGVWTQSRAEETRHRGEPPNETPHSYSIWQMTQNFNN